MGEIADGDGRLLRHLLMAREKISKQSVIDDLKKILKENYTPEDFSCSASLLMEPSK